MNQYPRNINHSYRKPVVATSSLAQEKLRPKRFKPFVTEEQIEHFVKRREKMQTPEQISKIREQHSVISDYADFQKILITNGIPEDSFPAFRRLQAEKRASLIAGIRGMYAFGAEEVSQKVAEEFVFGNNEPICAELKLAKTTVGREVLAMLESGEVKGLKEVYLELVIAFPDGPVGESVYDALCNYFAEIDAQRRQEDIDKIYENSIE